MEKLLGDNNGEYGKSWSLIIFRLEQTNIGIGVINADTLLFFLSPILNCFYRVYHGFGMNLDKSSKIIIFVSLLTLLVLETISGSLPEIGPCLDENPSIRAKLG